MHMHIANTHAHALDQTCMHAVHNACMQAISACMQFTMHACKQSVHACSSQMHACKQSVQVHDHAKMTACMHHACGMHACACIVWKGWKQRVCFFIIVLIVREGSDCFVYPYDMSFMNH